MSLAYYIATHYYRQGMECDHAARAIRRKLPEFINAIREDVKGVMKGDYNPDKENTPSYHSI